MLRVTSRGEFGKTMAFLNRALRGDVYDDLDRYGQMGVEALSSVTPKKTGLTASSWSYRVIKSGKHVGLEWFNSNRDSEGTPVAILIQYGHATGTGGYVSGRDYINPVMRPLFDKISNEIWKKVNQ